MTFPAAMPQCMSYSITNLLTLSRTGYFYLAKLHSHLALAQEIVSAIKRALNIFRGHELLFFYFTTGSTYKPQDVEGSLSEDGQTIFIMWHNV